MTKRWDKYRFYENTLRRLMIYAGLWPELNSKMHQRVLLAFHAVAGLFAMWAVTNYCQVYFGNRQRFMSGFALLMAYLTVIIKTISLTLYRTRLEDLHHNLAKTVQSDLRNEELKPIFLSSFLWFYRPTMILASSTWTAIGLSWFKPLIVVAIQLSKGATKLIWILPLSTVYPYKIDSHTWRYPVHYLFEIYSGVTLAIFSSSSDALFGYYMFQLTGQLRTLSHRIKNLASSKNYQEELRDCVDRHQVLARCQDHVNRIYGPIILWLLVTNALIMCALVYEASHVKVQKAIAIVIYIGMKSIQTLVYGWFGTMLTNESNNLNDAVYSCAWPGSGQKRLMTDVLILLMYKPFVLSACSVANVSVDMFVNVVNTAMSYFFMLRTMDEKNEMSGS
ncbi:odorant receptor 49b-like [Venturia canescens]|uniref:odorant receptor 49b-like n=1 Tax=Venturia canescens TaxID=32260 RepID=UPI001C9C35FE|nr:odorant receptor 49b-like [Venturia canescens]